MFHEGQQLGEYSLIEKLGRGGFDEVWLAEYEDNLFAIKLPHKDQVDWKEITQEIGLWTLCGKHPNVMPLIGARNFNGQIAIISEYAPDGSLEDLLRKQGKLSVQEAVEITIGILEGLQHLHESGIIHRDLKPANILLNGKTPRLTDFGISRIISADSVSETISGTWAYMAPECFDGKRNIQTDIWAVGVILYKMLTGNLPFPRKEQTALVGSIIMSEPESLSLEISTVIRKVVSDLLSKNADNRPTLSSVRFDLENYIDDTFGFLSRIRQRETLLRAREELLQARVLIPYRKGDKWGFCDKNKNLIIEPRFDEVYSFSEEIALVKLNDKYGFINSIGQEKIEIKYDDANPFSEGLAVAYLDENYGYINKNGEEVIDFIYDSAGDFQDGLAYVEIRDTDNTYYTAFINKNGEEAFDLHHFADGVFQEELCCVVDEKGEYGFINKLGETVISLIYDEASSFSEGISRVRIERKYGYINKNGEKILNFIYDNATDFIGGIALVECNNRKFFINKLGNEVSMHINNKYDDFYYFDKELIKVKVSQENSSKGKYGFIDKSGNEIISTKYDWTGYRFVSDLIKVKLNNKYFYVGRDGTEYFED